MLCTIIDIRGDYAFVKYDDSGIVSEVALALLPFGVDVGDRLKFEDFRVSKKPPIVKMQNKLMATHQSLLPGEDAGKNL